MNLKICVEFTYGRSQGLNRVGRLITVLQEWSLWRKKRSTKLSFIQFAADSVCPVKRAQGVVEGRGRAAGTGARLLTDLASAPSCYTNGKKCFFSSNIRARPSFTWSYSSTRDKARSLYIHTVIPVPTGWRDDRWKDQSQTIANLYLESAAAFVNRQSLKERKSL